MTQDENSTQKILAGRWQAMRDKKAFLALADGTVFRGYSVGAPVDALGEAVFNTGMTGYQEILSDPSYSGQFVVMTAPEIGNTGMNQEDMEACKLYDSGFVMHECNEPSNWRCEESLVDALQRQRIPALAGVDTRALTLHLRERGTLRAYLSVTGEVSEADAVEKAQAWEGLDGQDYAARVTCAEAYEWDPDDRLTRGFGMPDPLPEKNLFVVAYDFGIKWNILRGLREHGMRVRVVPARTPAEEVLALKPDGVFLSNGPADPQGVTYAVEAARALIGKVSVMGICLGHQLLALATGAKTYRLKFGHHGCNHPVKNLDTSAVEITSQNHNFAVDADSIDRASVEITHINLNDNTVEGLRHKSAPMFAVQYHPEAAPGPRDPHYLFKAFREMIKTS